MRLRDALTRTAGRRSRPRPAPGQHGRSVVGQPAPAITGVDPQGRPLTVIWEDGRRAVVGFMTTGCEPCRTFWSARAEGAALPGTDFVAVTPGPETESRRAVASLAGSGGTVVMSGAAWFAYGAGAAPWFAVVSGGIVVRTGNCVTWPDLEDLAGPP